MLRLWDLLEYETNDLDQFRKYHLRLVNAGFVEKADRVRARGEFRAYKDKQSGFYVLEWAEKKEGGLFPFQPITEALA
jgi:hypothetical protein